jgi:hypothetical protein
MSDSKKDIGRVLGLAICPVAGQPMVEVTEVEAIAGVGFKGNCYSAGEGSWNKGKPGKRQVTLMNSLFFPGSGFQFRESRRNGLIEDLELMFWLFRGPASVGEDVLLRAVGYCDPCERPNELSGNSLSFREAFVDRGGIIVEVVRSGIIKVGDLVTPPARNSK